MILNPVIPKWAETGNEKPQRLIGKNGKPSAVIPAQAGI